MFNKAFAKVFGTANERAVKRMLPALAQINAFEDSIKVLSDDELRAKTTEFQARISAARDAAGKAEDWKASTRSSSSPTIISALFSPISSTRTPRPNSFPTIGRSTSCSLRSSISSARSWTTKST